jgi:hypothetical protein
MQFKRLAEKITFKQSMLTKVALGATIAVSILCMAFFAGIDSIVNGDLYKYSLRYSDAWYSSYSMLIGASFVCLGIMAVVSASILGLSLLKVPAKTAQPVVVSQTRAAQFAAQKIDLPHPVTSQRKVAKPQEGGHMCPACNRVFTKPLVMLDFVNGEAKMISTCPYCSAPVEVKEEEKKPEFTVELPDSIKEKTA